MSGPERSFRTGRVAPFLRTLKNTLVLPIQQKTICGDPDYILLCCGKFVGLELKAPKGHLSRLQRFKLSEVERCGGIAIVASPSNWDEVKERLRRVDGGLVW